jgi:hypothetical protein
MGNRGRKGRNERYTLESGGSATQPGTQDLMPGSKNQLSGFALIETML